MSERSHRLIAMRVAVRNAWRGLRARRGLRGLARLARSPERLLIAPQDIRTRDPTVAIDIYAGQFAFAGRMGLSGGASPFEIEPPSPAWQAELLGFGWLRHLQAAESALARANARALVSDWMDRADARPRTFAAGVEVAGRRLISLLTQSPLVLDGADAAFYRRFMKKLGQDATRLVRGAPSHDPGARLQALVALSYFALCTEQPAPVAKRMGLLLSQELDAQVLPDGGHVSRNPAIVLNLLLDLLPLRQGYVARRLTPPRALVGAIDRLAPMLRMMRHGDGAVALFNGMGVTPPDMVSTVLAYDDTHSRPIENAPHTGYQRLSAGGMTAIVDAGKAPRGAASIEAHAGALSVEISDGIQRVVINCGAPSPDFVQARRAARLTAAHSTLTVADRSSSVFSDRDRPGRGGAAQIFSGPRHVLAQRVADEGWTMLELSHDGYAPAFGLVHRRELRLADGGGVIAGVDRIESVRAKTGGRPYALRFHLHPAITADAAAGAGVFRLSSPRGAWRFSAEGGRASLEESVLLASLGGPRRIAQIVIEGDTRADPEVRWRLERIPG